MDAPRAPDASELARAQPIGEPAAGLPLHATVRILLKHKWGIAGLMLALTLLALLWVHSLEPVYRATTTLLLETQGSGLSPVDDDITGGWLSFYNRQSYLNTQIALIRSRALAEDVAERLDLWQEPQLDPRRPAPRRARFQFDLERWLPWREDEPKAPISDEAARDGVIAALARGVSAEAVPDADIVELSFELPGDPQLAARIANGYARSYIDLGLESRLEQVEHAAGWLAERLDGVRAQLEASEQALQRYRDTHGLVAASGEADLTDLAVADLADRLVDARAERDRIETLYRQARGIETLDGAGFAAHPTVSANPVIQALKTEEVEAERQVQELSKRYGERHPKMVAAREDLRTLRAKLRAEVASVVASLGKERDIARGRVEQLEAELEKVKTSARAVDRKAFALAALERDVEANRQLYELFLTRFKETDLGADLESTRARVIDAALVPSAPVKPRKTRILLLTLVLSGALGVGLAFLLEQLDNTVKGAEDVEDRLRLTLLGTVPLLRGRDRRRSTPARQLLDRPKSEFSEAFRTLRTGVVLAGIDRPFQRLLITSSVPGEGKTMIAIGLAQALSGLERVLLVDADLRRASIARQLGIDEASRGLSDLVSGEADVGDCIQCAALGELDVLPAGTRPPNPLELLSSQRFAATLAALSERYDRVVVDSAPAQAVSDALVLSKHCDGVVFAIKADATPLPVVEIAVKRLRQVSAPLIGAVLNQVDNRRSARYGYYRYGRYSRYSYAYGGYSAYDQAPSPHRTADR